MYELTIIPTEEQISRFRALVDDLLLANQHVNLTSVRDPEDAYVKHAQHSLQGLETGLFDAGGQVVDVGAGAGFPGLAIAMARPNLKVIFVEATRKKCEFIKQVIGKYGLSGSVVNDRAETVGQRVEWRGRFGVATARAVGSMSEVCELTLPLVKMGGHVVLWRGRDAEKEVRDAKRALALLGGKLEKIMPYRLPGHEVLYHLVVIKKVAETPKTYPRRVGLPKMTPL